MAACKEARANYSPQRTSSKSVRQLQYPPATLENPAQKKSESDVYATSTDSETFVCENTRFRFGWDSCPCPMWLAVIWELVIPLSLQINNVLNTIYSLWRSSQVECFHFHLVSAN